MQMTLAGIVIDLSLSKTIVADLSLTGLILKNLTLILNDHFYF